jgi:hypothetical protein
MTKRPPARSCLLKFPPSPKDTKLGPKPSTHEPLGDISDLIESKSTCTLFPPWSNGNETIHPTHSTARDGPCSSTYALEPRGPVSYTWESDGVLLPLQ